MEIYYTIIVFVFGALFGSFFNVVGYRLPKGESIVFPASHCPNCNHKLSGWELIPILSFLCLGGKCKKCKQKISWMYPVFEFITGSLFALSYVLYGFSIDFVIAITVVSTLLIVIISDLRYFIIPDEVLLIGSILLLLEYCVQGGWEQAFQALINGVIAFGIMFAIKCFGDRLFKKESMGGGDIKLLFFFGMIFGWPSSILSIFLASFIGLPISLFILYKKKTHVIPFGPFLSVAAFLLFFLPIDMNMIIDLLILK